jgi:hypothetical protein
MKRLGSYQRVVMKGIHREGSQPITIKNGYSKQVKSLIKRRLITTKGESLILTKKGMLRIKRL